MTDIDCVVWGYDGVLNRNIVNGRFLWTETFEADQGVSLAHFRDYILSDEFRQVLLGEKSQRDHIAEWAETSGFGGGSGSGFGPRPAQSQPADGILTKAIYSRQPNSWTTHSQIPAFPPTGLTRFGVSIGFTGAWSVAIERGLFRPADAEAK